MQARWKSDVFAPSQHKNSLRSFWLNALSPGNVILVTVTNIFLTLMVQSPSYGLKPPIMGPSIFSSDLRGSVKHTHTCARAHTHHSHLSHNKWAALSNMDEGATWRLGDPHFLTVGGRLVQPELMKHAIRGGKCPPQMTPVQKHRCPSVAEMLQ